MIAYVTVGADDITLAKRFYSAFLPALGCGLEEFHGDLSYVLPIQPGQSLNRVSLSFCQISMLNHPSMDDQLWLGNVLWLHLRRAV